MRVWAIAMVRDEADIVARTVSNMARQVDEVLVADNRSRDSTRRICERAGAIVVDDPEPGYYQSVKMTTLAERARKNGAEWIVPFDADEYWQARSSGDELVMIRDALAELPDHIVMAEATMFDHVATGRDYGVIDPVRRLRWRRPLPVPMRKVAVRALPGLVIHQGNHSASFPGIQHPAAVLDRLVIRHFPYRSPEQFVRKVRNGAEAYAAAAKIPEDTGAHWRSYGRILEEQGEDALRRVFFKWFYRTRPDVPIDIEGEAQPPLVCDPCVP